MTRSARRQFVPQFVVLAVLACVPPIALIVTAISWNDPASQVPTHWGFTGEPTSSSSTALFWTAWIPSLICALVAIAGAIFLGSDVGRWSTASGFGILLGAGAAIALQWPVAQLTAGIPGLHDAIGVPFALYLGAVVWGAIGFAIGATRRPFL